MINVALSIHDPKGTYARHAGVVIASVLQNTDAEVRFYILHDETLTEENRAKLMCAAKLPIAKSDMRQHGDIEFIDVAQKFALYTGVGLNAYCGKFTIGALYRLTLPDIMPNLNKVLYLDCDLVVAVNVEQLWQLDMAGRSLAGVLSDRSKPFPNLNVPKNEITLNRYRYSNERYINSGVLLMDLSKMRRGLENGDLLLNKAVSYIQSYKPMLPDEAFFNAEYLADILYLDPKYNTDPTDEIFDDILGLERIWHFGGHLKPWDAFTGTNADMLYWKYLVLTPWKDELWGALFAAATNDKYYHRHSCGCVKRLKTQIIEEIKNALKFKK